MNLCLESESRLVMSDSLQLHRLYSPWNSPGQNTGMGCLSLHQGIFPTQGSNPGLPHCGQILYQLSRKGSPRILEWVAYPFSRVSSQPRDWTQVSHIVGGFFTSWATREAPLEQNPYNLLSLNSKGILQSLHWCIEKALNFTADSPSYFLSKVGFWR